MSYYNYNNAKLELASYVGGSWGAAVPIYVENLAISLTNNLKAIDLLPNRSSFSYTAGGGINGSLSLGYYLTGEDFLADFMEADYLISGNFAGLSFSSGVLSSYSFEVAPFGPIMVSANINFYGGLRGRFTPTRETLDADILTYTDCKLTQISGVTPHEDGETEQITASTSVSFAFSNNVQPIYTVGDTVPRELRFNRKTIDASINGYTLPSWDEGVGDFTSDAEQQNYLNDKFFSGIAEGELLIGFSTSRENTEWPIYTSDWSTTTDGWTNTNTTYAYPYTIDGESDAIKVIATSADAYHKAVRDLASYGVTAGKEYKITAKIYIPSGGDTIRGFQFRHGNGTSGPIIHPTLDTWYDFSYEYTVTDNSTYDGWTEFWMANSSSVDTTDTFEWAGNAATDIMYIKDVVVTPVLESIQSYKIRGTLKAHNINVTAGEKITTTLSLSQEKYQNAPAITSFTPTAGVAGATITISGADLENVTEVTFGDEKRVYTHFTTHTSDTIVTTIPDEAITCRVGLKSPGGDAKLGAATNYGDGMPGIFTVQDGGF